jgi:hypothetical protein
MTAKTGPACGAEIVYGGRGRPRHYCADCRPPGSGGTAWRTAWQAEHHDELEAERRKAHAEFMARMDELRRNRLKQIARNRRALERRKQPT